MAACNAKGDSRHPVLLVSSRVLHQQAMPDSDLLIIVHEKPVIRNPPCTFFVKQGFVRIFEVFTPQYIETAIEKA